MGCTQVANIIQKEEQPKEVIKKQNQKNKNTKSKKQSNILSTVPNTNHTQESISQSNKKCIDNRQQSIQKRVFKKIQAAKAMSNNRIISPSHPSPKINTSSNIVSVYLNKNAFKLSPHKTNISSVKTQKMLSIEQRNKSFNSNDNPQIKTINKEILQSSSAKHKTPGRRVQSLIKVTNS